MDEPQTELQALNRKIVEENIVIICIINIFVVSGLFGNILSVYFFGFKERKNSNDVLIATLTACNVTANVLAAAEQKKNFNYLTFTDELGCKVHYFLTFSITKLNAMVLFFIALNRQRCVCNPFSWQMTPKIIALSIIAAVLYSISSSIVQLMIARVEQINILTIREHGTPFENLEQANGMTDNMSGNSPSIEWMNVTTGRNETDKRVNMPIDSNRTEMNTEGKDVTTEGNVIFFENKLLLVNLTSQLNNNRTSKYSWSNYSMVAHVCTNMGTSNDSKEAIFQMFNLLDVIVTSTILILIIYCYGSIAKVVSDNWKRRKKLQEERNTDNFKKQELKFRTDIKITIMLVIFTLLAVVTITPYFVVKSLLIKNLVDGEQIRLRLISSSYMIHSAIDPYVLLAFIRNFRYFVKHLICFCFIKINKIRKIRNMKNKKTHVDKEEVSMS